MKSTLIFLLLMAGVFLIAATSMAGEVNLSVAASLKDVINEISDNYAKAHPGVKLVRNYGGSGRVAKQIENGAPADLFISANRKWTDYLLEKRLVDASRLALFAYNTLVFAGMPGKAGNMGDLPRLERIALGSPRSVPAGEYAEEAIRNAGLAKRLEKKLVMARDVRECLMYAERGEVDGAFVYRTDALLARRARILFAVPQELYSRVAYPMVLTIAGAKNADAVAFRTYLLGGEAKRVLTRYGFSVR